MSIPRVQLGRLGAVPGEVLPYTVQPTKSRQPYSKILCDRSKQKMADISVLRHTEFKTGIDCALRAFIHLLWVGF